MDFHKISYLNIFRKNAEKIIVSLKPDKSNEYVTWRPIYIFDYSRSVSLTVRNVSGKVVEEIKTHLLRSVTPPENLTICEIKWKNIVEPGRPQTTIWCWIQKAINKKLKEWILHFHCKNGFTNEYLQSFGIKSTPNKVLDTRWQRVCWTSTEVLWLSSKCFPLEDTSGICVCMSRHQPIHVSALVVWREGMRAASVDGGL